jgi:CRISPR-associated endonuclease Cas1
MLRSLDDDSHVQTRIAQYQASVDERSFEIAKNVVFAKLDGLNNVLEKHGFEHFSLDYKEKIGNLDTGNLEKFRQRITGIEGKCTQKYYEQIFSLLPEKIRPKTREGFMAYDGMNNIFNLAYEVLAWKIHRALIKAKLEPYLGFLHSNQMGKLSLVCDFQELYRYLIDDFLIQYCQGLNKKDFVTKTENTNRKRKGKREYLSDSETKELLGELNKFFESRVKVTRIRNGENQMIETLINEEALLARAGLSLNSTTVRINLN